jgi:hypothetical protein
MNRSAFSDLYFFDSDKFKTRYLGSDLSSLCKYEINANLLIDDREDIELVFLDKFGSLVYTHKFRISVPSRFSLDVDRIIRPAGLRFGSFLVFQYPRFHRIDPHLFYRERGYVHYYHKSGATNSICHGNIGNIKKIKGSPLLTPTEVQNIESKTFIPQRSWPIQSDLILLRFHNTGDSPAVISTFLDMPSHSPKLFETNIHVMGVAELALRKLPGIVANLEYSSLIPLSRPLVEFYIEGKSCGLFHS